LFLPFQVARDVQGVLWLNSLKKSEDEGKCESHEITEEGMDFEAIEPPAKKARLG
jgi:predicted transcriptional regulator